MPFEEIYSTVLSKLFIFPGMAEINIAEIDTLEKNLKKIWYFYFLKKNTSLFYYMKKFFLFEKYLNSRKYF